MCIFYLSAEHLQTLLLSVRSRRQVCRAHRMTSAGSPHLPPCCRCKHQARQATQASQPTSFWRFSCMDLHLTPQHTHTRTHAQTCTNTCVHTHMYTHKHTHIQTHTSGPVLTWVFGSLPLGSHLHDNHPETTEPSLQPYRQCSSLKGRAVEANRNLYPQEADSQR